MIECVDPAGAMRVALAPAADRSRRAFARIVFGARTAAGNEFRVPLRRLSAPAVVEEWHCSGHVEHGASPGIRHACGEDLCLLYAAEQEAGAPLLGLSRDVYDGLLDAAMALGYPNIVKAWNYLADINEGEGDDERYKQFCMGRGLVFDARLEPRKRAPAATGIGAASGEPMTIMLLASRHPVSTVENPRQVSAYRYPRRYGPRSPNFSRAAVHAAGNPRHLFISGTASIVGHESRHDGDVAEQTREALANLASLFAEVAAVADLRRVPALSDGARLRVYLRHAGDVESVTAALRPLLGRHGDLVVLEGDICRRELDMEVDGIIAPLPTP